VGANLDKGQRPVNVLMRGMFSCFGPSAPSCG